MELYVGGFGQDKLNTVLECKRKEGITFEKRDIISGADLFRVWEETSGRQRENREEKARTADPGGRHTPVVWENVRIIYDLHLAFYSMCERGEEILEEAFLSDLMEKNPHAIIICDEVGNGIVPVEDKKRRYREIVGRSCQEIAKRSDRVVRIVCGCPQVIKGENKRA